MLSIYFGTSGLSVFVSRHGKPFPFTFLTCNANMCNSHQQQSRKKRCCSQLCLAKVLKHWLGVWQPFLTHTSTHIGCVKLCIALHTGPLFGNPHFSRSGWEFGSRSPSETHTPLIFSTAAKLAENIAYRTGNANSARTENEQRERWNEKDEGTDVKFGMKWKCDVWPLWEGDVIFPLQTSVSFSSLSRSKAQHSRLIPVPMKRWLTLRAAAAPFPRYHTGICCGSERSHAGTHSRTRAQLDLHLLIFYSWFQMACIVLHCMAFVTFFALASQLIV